MCVHKLQISFLKETYTFSSSSSASLRILNSSTIFPECSMILASASVNRFLNQHSFTLEVPCFQEVIEEAM